MTLSSPSESEAMRLSRLIYCPNSVWNSPLLRSPEVRKHIETIIDHSELVSANLSFPTVTFLDFAKKEMISFHTTEHASLLSITGPPAFILIPYLSQFSGIMLHCAGILRNGKVALFMAPDEGGKTTVALSAETGFILGDDQVVLRREKDTLVAYGTPWGCYNTPHRSGMVAGIFLLKKSNSFSLTPLKPSVLIEYLIKELRPQWSILPKQLRGVALDFLIKTCHGTKTYRMDFSREYIDWNVIDKIMANI